MKKKTPKESASEKANPSPSDPVATDTQGGTGAANRNGGAGDYNREQVRRFIVGLREDCALVCDAVKNSLYDDGAGLLEDEDTRKRLGRIAYVDSFFRYFGACLTVEDLGAFLDDLLPRNLHTAGGVYDLAALERVPQVDIKLLKDILDFGDDDTSIHNVIIYFFALWVSFHVGAVVSLFRKWVEVYGENVPPVLRDMSALARCDCVYIRTDDNLHGGIFYDGGWFESFAMCGERRRKRQADADARQATESARAAHDEQAKRDAAARRDRCPDPVAVRSDPVGTGMAQEPRPDPSETVGAAVVKITAARVELQAGTVETATGCTDGRKQYAGHTAGGVSQSVFAGFCGVVKKTVARWENHPSKYPPPKVDGKRYEKGVRENGAGAFVFAQRYKDTKRGALKVNRGAGAFGIAEREAAKEWIRDNAAALRSEGLDLSEWGL